jgi:hypothetical protein
MVGWVICTYACIFGAAFSGGWFNLFTSLVATPTQNWTSGLYSALSRKNIFNYINK